MAIRLSGLASGIDTEGIIKELMNAQNLKKHKVQSKITKLEWKQEKWQSLNNKIYALYTDTVSGMRLESTYMAKKASSTNESKLSATASVNATEGTHTITVDRLASSQYLTGKALSIEDGTVTGTTTLDELGFDTSQAIQIKVGDGKAVSVEVDGDTTINAFVQKLKDAGINANFDSTYKRIFLSSKGSGVENAFSITTGSLTSGTQKDELLSALDFENLSDAKKAQANNLVANLRAATLAEDDSAIDAATEALVKFAKDNLTEKITNEITESAGAEYDALPALPEPEEGEEAETRPTREEYIAQKVSEAIEAREAEFDAIESNVELKASNYISAVENGDFIQGEGVANSALEKLGLTDVSYEVGENNQLTYTYNESAGATLVAASDAQITYNGVAFTSKSSNFSINGLDFTANSVTDVGEKVTVTVTKNVDAVYDKVKNFVTKYNELLKEMNTMYNATSARSYDVLTDDEKEAMTDDQIEKWETKIKDSLLRRDQNLGDLINAMRTSLNGGISIDGISHSLTEFGITTSNHYTENGLLHIHGDETDAYGLKFSDKLKEGIAKDPDTVMKTLSGIMGNLYSTMQKKMSASSVSSALTFYNDKEMNKTMTSY
ncbi:MAG: flagellar filament capping protein FliD, partial [Lachnospiraceae bacterium]|nr:flagellar filament capping protein FliD [Lachnospiraceae bacterium]